MVSYSFGTRLTRLSDGERREGDDACITVMTLEAVSYTHLTLPTILLV